MQVGLDFGFNAGVSVISHVVSRAFGWRCEHHTWQEVGLYMAEPAWQQARLIATSGINGSEEQERRAWLLSFAL